MWKLSKRERVVEVSLHIFFVRTYVSIWDINDKQESSLLFLSILHVRVHQYGYTDTEMYETSEKKKNKPILLSSTLILLDDDGLHEEFILENINLS